MRRVELVGRSCQMNSDWDVRGVPFEQNVHLPSTVSDEFGHTMLVCPPVLLYHFVNFTFTSMVNGVTIRSCGELTCRQFYLGLMAVVKSADVLDGYAAARLRRDLHPWLSQTQHVRRSLVLPATAHMHALAPAAHGGAKTLQTRRWLSAC